VKGINAVVQYLDWAMCAAQAEANPDCREVIIRCLLGNARTTITSFVRTDAPKGAHDPAILTHAMDIVFAALTGPKKFNRQGCIETIRKALKTFRGDK
jgi:hypothetical protein